MNSKHHHPLCYESLRLVILLISSLSPIQSIKRFYLYLIQVIISLIAFFCLHCHYLSLATINPHPFACKIYLSHLLWLHSEAGMMCWKYKSDCIIAPWITLKWLSNFFLGGGAKNKNSHCGLLCPVWTGLCCPLQLLSRPYHTTSLSFLECSRLLAPSHSLDQGCFFCCFYVTLSLSLSLVRACPPLELSPLATSSHKRFTYLFPHYTLPQCHVPLSSDPSWSWKLTIIGSWFIKPVP